jgi:hypothetical protein
MNTHDPKVASAEDTEALQDGWVTAGTARKPASSTEASTLVRTSESWNWKLRLQDGWNKSK